MLPSFAKLVEEHDANSDGVIQQSEFPRLWIFHRPEGIEAPQNGAPIRFRSVDRNKDEGIIAGEWGRQLRDIERFRNGYNENDFASASSTTDGKQLYCWFGSAGLYCYDLDGNKVWERDLGEAKVGSSLGEGCSPVLHEGKLVIVRDHAGQSSIEVLDGKTGDTLWQRERDEDNAWATPRVIQHSGKTQVITAASGAVRSYDLNSGEIIWQYSGLTGNVTPCPVIDGDYVICMSGYQGYAAMAIPLTETGDMAGSEKILWKRERGTPYIPSPLLYDALLFYNQSNQSILTCVDSKTGEAVFGPERIGQLSSIYASPVGASGRVYITGRNGTTLVLERSADFKVLASNQLDERIDASPALADGHLFLRGAKHLYCVERL
ncbi:MAG: hypothetical protein Aurels2KO_46590 [Aureliella sp.]